MNRLLHPRLGLRRSLVAAAGRVALVGVVTASVTAALAIGPAPTRLGGFGAEPPPPERPRAPPVPPAPAPEHLKYMSGTCASLQDGLRIGPSRGVSGATLAEVAWDYERRCRANEYAARQRLADEQQRSQRARVEREQQQTDAARRDEAQLQARGAQCGEMRRILDRRHERLASLTNGELADLVRFEANYTARCPGR